jgi:uncharacterized protein (TIGR02996 family)
MRTFEYKDDKSNKFWSIELQGNQFTVTFGRIGTAGQTQVKTFPDEAAAQKEHDKLIREKLGKGYVEKSAPKSAPRAVAPLQAALEQALADNWDDLAAHHAYADYLMEQGDPRGELVQVQLALEDPKLKAPERKKLQKREQAILDAHLRGWLGELAPYLLDQQEVWEWAVKNDLGYKFRLSRGWVDYLRLFHIGPDIARAVASNPLLRLLHHLVTRSADYEDPGGEELTAAPFLGNLRSFELGEEGQGRLRRGEVFDLFEKMPRIEELRLYAHGVDVQKLFALPLPHLRVLHVHHLHEYPLEVLAANRSLGNVRELAFWPHALEPDDDAAYITPEAARALFHSPHLKSLTHLEMRLTDFGDAGCEEIVRSGILKRLKVLNLTGGRITDTGARTLAACPDLKHLEKLDLTNNALTGAGIQALKAAGVALEAAQQFNADSLDQDPEHLWYGDCE